MNTDLTQDARVREDVIDEMRYDPEVTVNDIAVVVRDGTVTLTGISDSFGTRRAAELAAWRVNGVRGVTNEIVVDPTLLGEPTDEQIAADLRERLDRDVMLPHKRITVSVLDGIATLSGTVDWHWQRESAWEVATFCRGVRDVNNRIAIDRSGVKAGDVAKEIQKALVRNAQLDASNINVAADGGAVTLTGKVRSYAERKAAESAAWRAKGTLDVIDKITIAPL